MADNRRVATRHPVSIQAKLVVDGAPIVCTVVNLSLGGALVAIEKRYAMGQRVQIGFAVPTNAEPVDVGAVVRWSSAEGLGVQFDGLRARDVWALNEYFKQLS